MDMKKILSVAVLLIHVLGVSPGTHAMPFIWVDLMGSNANNGLTAGLKVNVDKGIALSAEMLGYTNCIIMCGNEPDYRETSQFNFLLGKRWNYNLISVFGMAGLGRVDARKPNGFYDDGIDIKYYSKTVSTIGIPFELGVTLSKFIGIGAVFHANLNNQAPTYGLLIDFPIGYMN